ncbi:MAG TPA: ABC transporter permease [Gemmatimonadota bacterium]|nr:ABC transporter permease [Gemmatimonadota bacterium]
MTTATLTRPVKSALEEIQNLSILVGRTFAALVRPPLYWRDVWVQMDVIGVQSLVIVMLTGIFTGMVLALQSSVQLQDFGASMFVGQLVSASVIRELGPVLTALMVAGRVGSGIAAELGSMRVGEQIDALEAMGTDPIKKLVKPRVIAGIVMLPILTIATDFIAIVGGQLIAWLTLNQGASTYWSAVWSGLFMSDLFTGLAKPLVFGFIITTVACYLGLRTTGGTEGVGRSTTQAVVISSVLILASDFFLTKLFIEVFGH